MRILKITQSYFPFLDRGGPAVKVRALARGLGGHGHRVTVLTANLGEGQQAALGERSRWGWRSEEGNVETVYLRTEFRFRALTINPALVSFCRERLGQFDVAHVYGLYDAIGPGAAWLSRRRGIPYVVEPMGMYRPIDRAFFLKGVWHGILGRRMIAGACGMIATSELERQELVAGGIPAGKVHLRFNPVELAEFQLLPPRNTFRDRWRIPRDEPLVLFLSRLIPRKGADLLIEAFAEALPAKGLLAIVGPEGARGYQEHLRAVAEACGVSGRVRFTGALYGEEKKAALADADVFALPSSYENFANAAAEAVASGVPALVTDHCGIHSLLEGRAGLVVKREKGEIARALGTLIENDELRERLRAGCRGLAEELSVERSVESLEAIYGECLP